MHLWSILITVQRDATQSSLFIILQVHSTCFGCQPHPSSGEHKTVTTPDDGCGWHPKHVKWTCRIINRLLCVASRWTIINTYVKHSFVGPIVATDMDQGKVSRKPVPWRWLLDPGPFHLRVVVDKVVQGQGFLYELFFSFVSTIPPLLHTHLHRKTLSIRTDCVVRKKLRT